MKDIQIEYKRTDPSDTEIDIDVTIPAKEYTSEYETQLTELGKSVRMKGFRPGNAPKDAVEQSHGKEARTKALETIISRYAGEVLKREDIHPVIPPSVDVKEMTEKGDILFTLHLSVIPDSSLPDFSKLKAVPVPVTVEDKEVNDVIKRLWEDHRGKFEDKDDAWVKSIAKKLGFTAKTLKDLREEIKGAVKVEKSRISAQQFADTALKEAIALMGIKLPPRLLETEISEREKSFHNALHDLNMTPEEYAKSRGVGLEDLRKQWESDAKEAIETDVLLASFAKDRKITVTDEEIEREVEAMKSSAKDPSDKIFDNPEWRSYIERVLLKRKSYGTFVEEVGKGARERVGTKVEDKRGGKEKESPKSTKKKQSK